jgi:hypothetical protein
VLASYGNPGCSGRLPCTADLIVDGIVNDEDRDYVRLIAWGACEEGLAGGAGGGENLSDDPNDPFIALFMEALETFGFSTIDEYFEWLDSASDEEDLAVALTIQAILNQ